MRDSGCTGAAAYVTHHAQDPSVKLGSWMIMALGADINPDVLFAQMRFASDSVRTKHAGTSRRRSSPACHAPSRDFAAKSALARKQGCS